MTSDPFEKIFQLQTALKEKDDRIQELQKDLLFYKSSWPDYTWWAPKKIPSVKKVAVKKAVEAVY